MVRNTVKLLTVAMSVVFAKVLAIKQITIVFLVERIKEFAEFLIESEGFSIY